MSVKSPTIERFCTPPEPARIVTEGPALLPRESEALERVRDLLPARFVIHETARFVVLSDAEPAWTRHQIERLERAHHQFHRVMRRLEIEPAELTHKLVCVLFEQRGDYLDFALTHDGVTNPYVAGYYAPRPDRIVFYDPRSQPGVVHISQQLASARPSKQRGQAWDEPITLAHHHAEPADFGGANAERITIATTIHEAIHQLMIHTGVQNRTVEYPLWLSEGMAAAFETDRPNNAFGPDHIYAPRREAFIAAARDDRLIELRALVQMTRLPERDIAIARVIYDQSCALVAWLMRFRRTELASYIELMRAQPPGRIHAERQLALFERSFGDVDRLERAWLRHETATTAALRASMLYHRIHAAALQDRTSDLLPLAVSAVRALASGGVQDAEFGASMRRMVRAIQDGEARSGIGLFAHERGAVVRMALRRWLDWELLRTDPGNWSPDGGPGEVRITNVEPGSVDPGGDR